MTQYYIYLTSHHVVFDTKSFWRLGITHESKLMPSKKKKNAWSRRHSPFWGTSDANQWIDPEQNRNCLSGWGMGPWDRTINFLLIWHEWQGSILSSGFNISDEDDLLEYVGKWDVTPIWRIWKPCVQKKFQPYYIFSQVLAWIIFYKICITISSVCVGGRSCLVFK